MGWFQRWWIAFIVSWQPPDQGACLVLPLHRSQLLAQFLSSGRWFQQSTLKGLRLNIWSAAIIPAERNTEYCIWKGGLFAELCLSKNAKVYVLLLCSLPRFFKGLYRVPPHKEKPLYNLGLCLLWIHIFIPNCAFFITFSVKHRSSYLIFRGKKPNWAVVKSLVKTYIAELSCFLKKHKIVINFLHWFNTNPWEFGAF